MRGNGVRRLLIDGADYRYSYHAIVNADHWSGYVRLSDLESGSPVGPAARVTRTWGRILRTRPDAQTTTS